MFSPLGDGENEPQKSQEIVPLYTGSIHFFSFPVSETYCYQVLLA
jgi:hypothetical protein